MKNYKSRFFESTLIILRFFVLSIMLFSGIAKEVYGQEEIFDVVEKNPSFPGGHEAINAYMMENMSYPDSAKIMGVEGTVYLQFVVETDGSITNIKILRDIGYGCAEEAVRLVKSMPKWNPGTHRGKAVRVRYNCPIIFNLSL
jgi:protein TonB